MPAAQPDLFAPQPRLPEGFRYRRDLLSSAEEAELAAALGELAFQPFEFHGFIGKRRVLSFGWRYDFNHGGLQRADEIPPFLLPARAKAAAFAGLSPNNLQHVLVTEYPPGATIGWHKDRGVFADVIGVSLLAPCTFRLRRKTSAGWERAALTVEPRSIYLLRGPARRQWEHSIPAVDRLRYSITFRTLGGGS